MIEEYVDCWVVTLLEKIHKENKVLEQEYFIFCGTDEDYATTVYDKVILDSKPHDKVTKTLQEFTEDQLNIFDHLKSSGKTYLEFKERDLTLLNYEFPQYNRKDLKDIVEQGFLIYSINCTF